MGMYSIWTAGDVIRSKVPGRFAGVTTTGVFGRLDCPSGRRAHAENRLFFVTYDDAVAAGFRPCRVCRPRR
jgi:AraC family transcriptional regulator of adaptative response/methylated-DNA-[protein]-cysteine methyltransferase